MKCKLLNNFTEPDKRKTVHKHIYERFDTSYYSPSEARINSRNNGCGRCGREINSGWN